MTFRWGPPSRSPIESVAADSEPNASAPVAVPSRRSRFVNLIFGVAATLSDEDAHLQPSLRLFVSDEAPKKAPKKRSSSSAMSTAKRPSLFASSDGGDGDKGNAVYGRAKGADGNDSDAANDDDDDDNDDDDDDDIDDDAIQDFSSVADATAAPADDVAVDLVPLVVRVAPHRRSSVPLFDDEILHRVCALQVGAEVSLNSVELAAFVMCGGELALRESIPRAGNGIRWRRVGGRGFTFPYRIMTVAIAAAVDSLPKRIEVAASLGVPGTSKATFGNFLQLARKRMALLSRSADKDVEFERKIVAVRRIVHRRPVRVEQAAEPVRVEQARVEPAHAEPAPVELQSAPVAAVVVDPPAPLLLLSSQSQSQSQSARASQASQEVAVVPASPDEWECSMCTYSNAHGAMTCEICDARRVLADPLADKLQELESIGFTDANLNRTMLQQFGGNIERVVNEMLNWS
jgi:hypothetical protein